MAKKFSLAIYTLNKVNMNLQTELIKETCVFDSVEERFNVIAIFELLNGWESTLFSQSHVFLHECGGTHSLNQEPS
jgi:hypothetical protein